jgi:hypothetical protein
MISSKCNNTLKKTGHLMKMRDKNQEGKSLQVTTMQSIAKNNLLFSTLIIEIEIKDFCGLKTNKFNTIQIHLFNLKISTISKATEA